MIKIQNTTEQTLGKLRVCLQLQVEVHQQSKHACCSAGDNFQAFQGVVVIRAP